MTDHKAVRGLLLSVGTLGPEELSSILASEDDPEMDLRDAVAVRGMVGIYSELREARSCAAYAQANAKLIADLRRLCGPVCPHDGKYAVEHKSCGYRRSIGCAQVGYHTTALCAEVRDHPEWPEGEAWLRERSR